MNNPQSEETKESAGHFAQNVQPFEIEEGKVEQKPTTAKPLAAAEKTTCQRYVCECF